MKGLLVFDLTGEGCGAYSRAASSWEGGSSRFAAGMAAVQPTTAKIFHGTPRVVFHESLVRRSTHWPLPHTRFFG